MRYSVLLCLAAGCALPSFPMKVVVEPPPAAFAATGCRARVESIAFAPDVRLGNQSEAEFVAKLNPEQQKSYAGDKADMATRYLDTVRTNERDYLKSHGHVTAGATGDEPVIVRGQVKLFDPESGHTVAVHEVFDASQKKIGEFSVESSMDSWYGSGFRLRMATLAQAVTVLKFFADRFPCGR